MTDPNRTLVAVVLDRSGSMAPLTADTIGGFNAFIAEQRTQPGECTVTLTQFNHEYEVRYNALPIADVPELTTESYVPQGNTALLDAAARTIREVGDALGALPENERPGHVVVVMITDGEENSSHETTREALKAMIEHQASVYGWQFIYLGANVDAFAEAHSFGISQERALLFEASPQGMRGSMAAAAASVSRTRSGRSSAFTREERDSSSKS